MDSGSRPPAWKTLLAFCTIYFVWGSTFLAIRIGVREVPPFLLAGMRFLAAGAAMFAFCLIRGIKRPTRRQWLSALFLGALIFLIDYGFVFWAEQRVPSGVTAVLMAITPVFMTTFEILFLRTRRMTLRLAAALLVGLGGVAVLMGNSLDLGGVPIDRLGALALLTSAVAWSISSTLTRILPLPSSKVMSSGSQMLLGGVLLTLAAATLGEFGRFHPAAVSTGAWLSLLYLIVPGSIIAFTAFVWLLHHESPTKVGTHAYVNPAIAVLLGYFLGGEELGPRTVLGTLLVLVSVVVITTAPPAPAKRH